MLLLLWCSLLYVLFLCRCVCTLRVCVHARVCAVFVFSVLR